MLAASVSSVLGRVWSFIHSSWFDPAGTVAHALLGYSA